jgi:hypothetical protein
MTDTPNRSPEKPTEEWVTGDEPMTGPQASYLQTLAREAGVDVPEGLTKAQASELIDDLQQRTGRGEHSSERSERDGPHDLAERAEAEGIVDQQAAFLDDAP